MKAIIPIFGLGSAVVFASIGFAADSSVQPLTRADCDKTGMHWSERANVCAMPDSTAVIPQPSPAFVVYSQPLTRADCEKSGMRWNEAANVCADAPSQPLTRADCDSAGMRWNDGANVCSESTFTIGQAEAKSKSAASTKGSSILITIDKTTQRMSVLIDGTKKYDWRVSTGRPGYSTPSGTYTATSMNEVWYSKEWDNAPMPHAIFFMTDGHAIHGSYEVKRLGKPVSHGCVRIAPQNATLLYALVGKNGLKSTQIVLTGVTPGGESRVASRTPRQKPQVASRVAHDNIAVKPRSGPSYRYARVDPRWNGGGDQPRRGGLFRRLFSGASYNGPHVYDRPALRRGY